MKSHFGAEYPAAIVDDGGRFELASETRWERRYGDESKKRWRVISRFMDGSAAITFSELARDWDSWDDRERQSFCSACSWLHKEKDFPQILRYLMRHGDCCTWSAIALSVATHLPQEEAFSRLSNVLQAGGLEASPNIAQGICLTKHPQAEPLLRTHLMALWADPRLWEDDKFCNDIAFAAMCSINHLIEVGAPPHEFEEQVRALSRHVCTNNREFCPTHLGKYFPWLKDPPAVLNS